MKKQIAVLKGDGVGPEVVNQAIKVLEAITFRFGHKFELIEMEMGACSIDIYGVPVTDEVIRICKSADAILLGAIGDPKYDNDPSAKIRPEQGLLRLRKELGLHTNIRPIATYSQIESLSPLKSKNLANVDFVIFRELIGGIYFGEKKLANNGESASDLCEYNADQIEVVARSAFECAMQRSKKLTLVDKANVLETSRLWRKVVTRLSDNYPDVELEFLYVDNAAMQVIQRPSSFDVIVTENMFGDILSDLASVITGSIGMLPSASIGDTCALFEPIHGSYPQAKGKDSANPNATILAVAMMFDYFEMFEEAKVVRDAVQWSLSANLSTEDINDTNPITCSDLGHLIAEYIEHDGILSINVDNAAISKGTII